MDEEYRNMKAVVQRDHPKNIFWGIYQGVREFGRGLWSGFTGFVFANLFFINKQEQTTTTKKKQRNNRQKITKKQNTKKLYNS